MNGADLLASLPDGWRRVPLKATADFAVSNVDKHSFDDELPVRLCNYTDVYKNDRVSPDMDLMAATATPQEIERFHLEVGDVVITKDSESWNDIAIPAYVEGTADDFVCGYHLAFIRPRKDVLDGRFLLRCLQSRPVALQLELEATGVTRYGLPKDAVGLAVLPLPPLPTQHRIAHYLDRETARIDGLIAEKERMLALLEEKRAALISRVVTRGLDPNAPLKPSGQEWLGEIPAHWDEPRAKGLFREVDRRTETGEETLLSLRMGKGLVPHNDVSEKLLESSDIAGFKKIEPGQMVINRMRAASGLIAVATEPGLVSPDYAVFDVVDQDLSIEYFLELFKTSLLQAVFRSSSKGLGTGEQGFLRLYTDAFLSLHFPYPPIDEQHAIATFIDQQRSEMLQMETLLRRSIFLAKERRAALITAAVTGQIPLKEMAR